MPVVEVLTLVALAFGIAVSAAVAFWRLLLRWAETTLFPFLERSLPHLAPFVRKAFAWFDVNVATPIRMEIREAWRMLRERLLALCYVFRRNTDSIWVREVVSYVIVWLEGQERVVKHETEQVVDWDELPAEVRESWIRRGQSVPQQDVAKFRDRQIEEDEMRG